MNENNFRAILHELIDENPFSLRAVLQILGVEFTTAVPTLAVTCEEAPRLLVNLDFVRAHCRNDCHVKAVIVHEFLHVLLGHTEDAKDLTPERHLAFDAVINAIIHRQCGKRYSQMMAEYYAMAEGMQRLLRPMNEDELDYWFYLGECDPEHGFFAAWSALYAGQLIADDIETLAGRIETGEAGWIATAESDSIVGGLLGNHADLGREIPDALGEALDTAMKEMNGTGIWRDPWSRGIGARPEEVLFRQSDRELRGWQDKTLAVLRRHLLPDPRSRARREEAREYRIPVLSPGDRRAFLRATWAPFLPDAAWSTTVHKREGSAQVYLDVSGSMDREMPLIIALLGRLSSHIRRPFWAFSDEVSPAVIERGELKTRSTGGTSMSCVLEHVAETKPESAVVVTDGYIERVDSNLLEKARVTRLHAIVTRDGNPAALRRAGITYTQLEELPS